MSSREHFGARFTARRALVAVGSMGAGALVLAGCIPPPVPTPPDEPCTIEVLSEGEVEAPAVELHDGELEVFVLASEDHDHDHDHDADHDHEHGEELDPACVVLQANEAAETVIPAGESFEFLGDAGDPVWILPQSEEAGLLYLGYSTEDIDAGDLLGDELTFSLVDVDGPGAFSVYLNDEFGEPDVLFDSNQALPQALEIEVGEHTHVNWAFGAPGTYTVTYAFDAVTAGGDAVESGEVEFTYEVIG